MRLIAEYSSRFSSSRFSSKFRNTRLLFAHFSLAVFTCFLTLIIATVFSTRFIFVNNANRCEENRCLLPFSDVSDVAEIVRSFRILIEIRIAA